MLTEGTRELDKIQYTEALADIASSIDTYATDDTAGLILSSLSQHLDATFALSPRKKFRLLHVPFPVARGLSIWSRKRFRRSSAQSARSPRPRA